MARSYKRQPFTGVTCCESEKSDKRKWHRRLRAAERTKLASCPDLYEYEPVSHREVSDTWLMGKDGRSRFDPTEHPKYLRK